MADVEAMAQEIAGRLLGEETTEVPETTEVETAPEEVVEPVAETAEIEEEVTATPETEETKVPLKALQEEKRKRQEYEARLKELEERVQPKEETLEDIYVKDPQGTVSRINTEIAKLQNDDPFANAEQIERLRDLKVELRETVGSRQNDAAKSFQTTLLREVPDLPSNADAYTQFAIEQLGYDQATLATLTNPSIVGPQAAIAQVKAIANQFKKAQAAITVKSKAVQLTPTKSESPGTGIPSSSVDIGKLKAEARSTGDWSKYLDSIGALD